MAGRMEGFYLTCKIHPYFPIRLAEAGATREAEAPGAEVFHICMRKQRICTLLNALAVAANVDTLLGAGRSLQIHLRLKILSSQCSSSASHGQDNATVNVQISRSFETLATQYTEGKVVPFELPDDLIEVISEWKVKTIVLFFLKGVPGFF
ncbi:hypothetical protein SUGI_0372450 [Cryptomeria japonica]|nr:hypothetical protein SUGI_0372450 [Cryptomeria japonica]